MGEGISRNRCGRPVSQRMTKGKITLPNYKPSALVGVIVAVGQQNKVIAFTNFNMHFPDNRRHDLLPNEQAASINRHRHPVDLNLMQARIGPPLNREHNPGHGDRTRGRFITLSKFVM